MTAIVDIYCRVSTDPQEDNTSLDEQEASGRAYCSDNGLIVGMVHREVFSGYMYREREKIMDRTTTGRVNKAKEGKVVSGNKAPYGWKWRYKYIKENGEKGDKEVLLNRDVIINNEGVEIGEDEVSILQWLAEQYADGVAAHELMRQLNERGVPSPDGIEWNPRTIVRLISDPRITGKNAKIFVYQKRKTKQPLDPIDLPDGTYPEIISEELFERIQQRRETNRADAVRASKQPEEYLLRAGFVRCGYCNGPMFAIKHRKNYIYRCTHNNQDHYNVILSKSLDERIWQWLHQLADHITLIETAVELATNSDKVQKDTQAIERSIESWKAKARNYLSDLDDSSLIDDTRTAVRSALNNANKMVLKLEEERAQIMAGMIDKNREKEAYQDILKWRFRQYRNLCPRIRRSIAGRPRPKISL